jgi:exo-beta-1,3-glucanase (GH17 family)
VEKSAETPRLSVEHHPIGHEGLWHSKHPPLQLPAYIQNIRNALMRAGHDESSAHALAVAAVERWAAGGDHVHPEVRTASQHAVEEWEKLRAHHP